MDKAFIYYADNTIKVLQGECIELGSSLTNGYFELVLADHQWNHAIDPQETEDWYDLLIDDLDPAKIVAIYINSRPVMINSRFINLKTKSTFDGYLHFLHNITLSLTLSSYLSWKQKYVVGPIVEIRYG